MPRMTWAPGGIEDVRLVPVPPHPDPDSGLFQDTDWILVKTVEGLMACASWDQERTIAVICIEAVRERVSFYAWRTAAYYVCYVWREDVADLEEGPVANHERFRLRDLDRAFDPRGRDLAKLRERDRAFDPQSPVSGDTSSHQSTAGGPSGLSSVTVTPRPMLAGSAPASSAAPPSVSARTTFLL